MVCGGLRYFDGANAKGSRCRIQPVRLHTDMNAKNLRLSAKP